MIMEQADDMQKQINDWLHFITNRTTDTKFQLNTVLIQL